jgi:hypothetical protein
LSTREVQLAAPEGFSARSPAPARTKPRGRWQRWMGLLVSIIAIVGQIMPQKKEKINKGFFEIIRLAAQAE